MHVYFVLTPKSKIPSPLNCEENLKLVTLYMQATKEIMHTYHFEIN